MSRTYEPIATTTLGSAQANVNFTSIPGTYTDLMIVASLTALASANTVGLEFNSDTGNNYSMTRIYGDGSSAVSDRGSNNPFMQIGFGGTVQNTQIFQVFNYANTTTNKTALGRASLSNNVALAAVGLWRNTAAITSINIRRSTGNLESGSTFTLYGIKAA